MSQQQTYCSIRVGVQLQQQHTSYKEYAEAVRRVENLGVDSIWNWDHFFPLFGDPEGGNFEAWTLLTAMATLTQRATVGCLVTCNSYRNPSLLSDMAKTLDHISNGRLILGLGAGWFERDYTEFGYDFGTPGSRLAALEESLKIIRHRWEVDVPRPLRGKVPILIGGGGEKKTLRLAAQYADIWHGFGDSATLAHKIAVLNQWCEQVGRDPSEIEHSTDTSADDSDDIRNALVDAGVTHLLLPIRPPWDFEAVARLVRWRDRRSAS